MNPYAKSKIYLVAGLLIGTALSACGTGSGEGLDANGNPVTGEGPAPLAANLPSIQANVFDVHCATCHFGSIAPENLRLDSLDNSFSLLVNKDAAQDSTLKLVDPFAPDNSYLIRKLEGGPNIAGVRMPRGAPALSAETIAVVRQWISEGAEKGVEATGPARITSSLPVEGNDSTVLTDYVEIFFDQRLNPASVDINAVSVERAGGDGGFRDGNEVAITPSGVGLSEDSQARVQVQLLGIPDTPDTYRITLKGDGPTPIEDQTGRRIDGDGDGLEGGDFVLEFSVTAP